jgi:hypothetical protein
MNVLANSPFFWAALITGLLVLYILPSLIGVIRKVEGLGWLVVVNLIPTGIGWPAAMVLAIMLPRRDPPMAYPPIYHPQAPGQRLRYQAPCFR